MPEYPSPVRSRRISRTTRAGGTTSATIYYPDTIESGDRLICFIAGDTAQTFTFPGAWTELDQASSTDSIGVFWHIADGTEDGTSFTVNFTTADRDLVAIIWAIPSSGTPEVSTLTSGSSATPNFPPLTPSGGSAQYLWLACTSWNNNQVMAKEWPAGFGAWLTGARAGSVAAYACERVETATTLDPDPMTMDISTFWYACTIAVPVSVTAPSGFPVLEAEPALSNWGSVATSQTMNLPSSIASGDYLIAEVSVADGETASISGWTQLAVDDQTTTGTTYVTTHIFERIADGTEGASVAVTITGSGARGAAVVRRFSGVDDTKTEVATFAELDNNTFPVVDFPTLTPAGGSDKIAWLCGLGFGGDRIPWGWGHADLPVTGNDYTDHSNASIQEGAANSSPGDVGASNSWQSIASALIFEETTSFVPDGMRVDALRYVAYVVSLYPSGGGGGGSSVGESFGMIAA